MIEDMANVTLLLFLVCGYLIVNGPGALCCYCDGFYRFYWRHFSNISLNGNAEFYFIASSIDIYDCRDVEAHWEIQRADGETEMYTVANETYRYGRYDNLPDRGLSFNGRCRRHCSFYMTISPTDMRYNEAQITGVLNLPECFNSSNITDPMTLNIQGLLDAPTDVYVNQVSVESVNVSWTPPFTLNEVPILMYTVYITSQGYTETMNITETSITLERPCASTTYEISSWNEVGEGEKATYVLTMYQAIVVAISELFICASCSFFANFHFDGCAIADGCTIELQSNQYKFIFNMSRKNSHELTLLECFSVPEAGVYSVSVYEIQDGGTVGHKIWSLPQITLDEDSTEEPIAGESHERAVTGLAVVLSLTLVGVIVAILTVVIFIMKRRISQNTDNAFMASNGLFHACWRNCHCGCYTDDSTNRAEEPKSNKLATSLDENIQPRTATKDDGYEHVELRSTAAVQSEEIELSGNVAYGRVQK